MLATVVGGGLNLLLETRLAVWSGPDAFGLYAWVTSLVTLALLITLLGTELTVARFRAIYRSGSEDSRMRGLFRWSSRRVAGFSSVAMAIGMVCLWLLRDRLGIDWWWTLSLGLAVLPLASLLRLRQGMMLGLGMLVVSRLPELILRPAAQALISLGLYRSLGELSAPAAMAGRLGAVALALLVSSRILRRRTRALRQGEPSYSQREWTRTSNPLLVITLMRTALQRTDIVLVGALVGVKEAGIYAVATRLSSLVALGLQVANSVSLPMIAALHAQERTPELQRLVNLSAWMATGTSTVFATALVAGRQTILGLFGESFEAGGLLLIVLVIGQLFNAVTGPSGAVLNMSGHQKTNARILAWTGGLNLLLSAPAILVFGPLGAAIVTSTLLAAKNLATWWHARQRVGINASVFRRWSR